MRIACVRRFHRGEIYYAAYVPAGSGSGARLLACMPLGEERNHTARTVNLLLREAAEAGLVGVMYDYPGMGDSAGDTRACTLAAARDAGEEILDAVRDEFGGGEEVFLGIRSGVFVARELYARRGGRLLLWEPFVSGPQFVRELGLKERIRGELTGADEEGCLLLNGSPVSAVLKRELLAVRDVFAGLDPAGVHVVHLGRGRGPCARVPGGMGRSSVEVPPFWNPHEHWDTRACVAHTVNVIRGDRAC